MKKNTSWQGKNSTLRDALRVTQYVGPLTDERRLIQAIGYVTSEDHYRFQERLAMLQAGPEPTKLQVQLALMDVRQSKERNEYLGGFPGVKHLTENNI